MTIGEKIALLRTRVGMTQEQLAERVAVSRQSVSKWEMDQALPQIDKVLMLCDVFGVGTDELLRDKTLPKSMGGTNRYFGTDGFRGEANIDLTSMQAYKVGRFLGWYYSSHTSGRSVSNGRPKIVIGKDTRRSSYMLEYSIVAGITASGADAYMLHVTTTPSVSYVTQQDEFDCGIMITASHNPFYDNGIKIVNRYGEKLEDEVTHLIEAYLDGNMGALGLSTDELPLAHRERIGCIVDYIAGRNRYVAYLISLASHSYKKLRIGIDCANGASWMIARAVFGALGAQIVVIGDQPDGLNVNEGCGSTSMERLCQIVRKQHLDLGFAFDGDADRCLAVDENGNVIDGDAIMYILANRLRSRGMLNGDTVVSTVMSNSGLWESFKRIGIDTCQTSVGDRFVYECMQKNDYSLGGEQSGHIIIKKYATTGDGILTAIMLTEEICDTKSTLAKLAEPIELYPQVTKNLCVQNKDAVLGDPAVKAAAGEAERLIDGKGRVLLRKSGTEPKIRIMVEAKTEELCNACIDMIAEKIIEGGYCVDKA